MSLVYHVRALHMCGTMEFKCGAKVSYDDVKEWTDATGFEVVIDDTSDSIRFGDYGEYRIFCAKFGII